MHDDKRSRNGDEKPATEVPMSEIELTEKRPPWRKIRGGVLLGVGCVTSPCCTPLVVPAALALLAGTPLAAFLAQYIGWVYAVLTLVSLLTLFFGVRSLWQKPSAQQEKEAVAAPKPTSRQRGQVLPVKMDT